MIEHFIRYMSCTRSYPVIYGIICNMYCSNFVGMVLFVPIS